MKNKMKSLMFFSALVAAVVGDSLNANAALLSLNLYNTGATTTKWDAPVQVLANVPTPATPPVDLHYTVPVKAGVSQPTAPGNRTYNASSASATALHYAQDPTKSLWIGVLASGIGNNAAAGTYIYQTSFSLAQATQGEIAGKISSDNSIFAIRINGVYVAGTAASTATNNPWYPAGSGANASYLNFKTYDFLNVNLKAGTNTIQFYGNNNAFSKTGINNIFTTANAVVPEPSTFALLGLGIAGMAVAGYRRRRTVAV